MPILLGYVRLRKTNNQLIKALYYTAIDWFLYDANIDLKQENLPNRQITCSKLTKEILEQGVKYVQS